MDAASSCRSIGADLLPDGFDRVGSGVTSPLLLRITRAFADAGRALTSSTGWKRVDGGRQRMEPEGLIEGPLFSRRKKVIGLINSGDHLAPRWGARGTLHLGSASSQE